MKNLEKSFPYAAMFIGIFVFLSIFVGAGLMGENHRVDDLINDHFKKIKAEDYSAACFPLTIESRVINAEEAGLCSNQHFLLYISLLERFALLEEEKYSVKVKRGSFWLPFTASGNINVSISFQKEEDKSWIPFLGKTTEVFINDLFIVKRDKWKWVISEATINDSKLVEILTHFEKTLDFDKYIEQAGTHYQFKNAAIDSENITQIDKRLLRFNLQKIAELLK